MDAKKIVSVWMSVLLIAFVLAIPSAAQQSQQNGLVNVDISNVANNIAQNLKVNVSQIPVTVQVPIGIAANVCGVAANVLSSQAKQGNATCQAKTTNQALNQVVQRQIKNK